MLKWLDNFWYHHKWAVIISAFFLITVIICTVQLVDREDYDAYVMFIGNGGTISGTEYHDILSSLGDVAFDADKNGEISVCFGRETYIAGTDGEFIGQLNSNITSFMQSSLYTDNYIYIIDPELYESYKDSGVFVPLSDYCGNIPEEMSNDELSIKLGKTSFYSKAGISTLPPDMLIVLKTVPYFSSSRKTAAATEMQSVHAQIIRNIVNLGLYE